LLIALGVGILVGLAAVGATARSASATLAAVPAGTPNLALIALAPADVPGGRVLHQGYFTDPDLVAGYDREFKAGASIGHSRALSLDNEIDVLEDAAEAHSAYASGKKIFGSPGGRALLTKSIVDEFKKEVKGKGGVKVTYGKMRSLFIGDETFVQPITVTLLNLIRFSFVLSVTREDRLISWMSVTGQPGGKVAIEDVAHLQRLVAGRILTALTPANTALPTVTGTATEGQVLTGADGTWTNTPTGFTRAWLKCDAAGANCVAVPGATASTYTVATTDVGSTLRFSVAATTAPGTATTPAISGPTAVVTAAVPPPTP
jgi:hypothetical protein